MPEHNATPDEPRVDPVVDDALDVAEASAHPTVSRAPSARDMARAFFRPSKGQLAVGLLCMLLGFGGVLQVRTQQGSQAWAGARRDDLVSMIDSLDKEHQRLAAEQDQLEHTKQQLQSGNDSHQVAADEAQRRIATLGILAGTAPAYGPGIQLTIEDPQGKVTPAMLLDCVEELRDAGAEAIEINDKVRIVANTAFTTGPDGITVGGQNVTFPLRIDAIGDPSTLEAGARFRGGIVSQVQAPTVGGSAVIVQQQKIEVTSTVTAPTYSRAKPAK